MVENTFLELPGDLGADKHVALVQMNRISAATALKTTGFQHKAILVQVIRCIIS
jgi:hypothetical protein